MVFEGISKEVSIWLSIWKMEEEDVTTQVDDDVDDVDDDDEADDKGIGGMVMLR